MSFFFLCFFAFALQNYSLLFFSLIQSSTVNRQFILFQSHTRINYIIKVVNYYFINKKKNTTPRAIAFYGLRLTDKTTPRRDFFWPVRNFCILLPSKI